MDWWESDSLSDSWWICTFIHGLDLSLWIWLMEWIFQMPCPKNLPRPYCHALMSEHRDPKLAIQRKMRPSWNCHPVILQKEPILLLVRCNCFSAIRNTLEFRSTVGQHCYLQFFRSTQPCSSNFNLHMLLLRSLNLFVFFLYRSALI